MSFFNGYHSPSTRPLILPSSTSPFCTSPSQLQEVTLDQDATFSNSMGLRSPGGPMRGRSVKEFEEQLANLKKENFNLKLRIYFLEERMGSNYNLDKENVTKKNVELMVEVESLRKELQEKHDLLCQAVKAMELEDEEHKKLVSEKDEMLSNHQQEIENLKTQLLETKPESGFLSPKSYQSEAGEFLSSQAFNMSQESGAATLKDLQEKINLLEEELNHEKENSAAIQMILDQTNAKIKNLMSELDQTNQQLSSRDKDLSDMNFRLEETKTKCQGLHKKLQENSQLIDEISNENDQLRKRQSILVADLDKERRRYEKLKLSSDQKNSDLQSKLEASLTELKKSQELVVSNNPVRRIGNTDADSFSVQKSATPSRSPQKDSFLHALIPSPLITPTSSPTSSVNFSSDTTLGLKHVIEQLKTDRDSQHQKIVKLKAEQMKACKIIKSMIESRNKTNEEIAALKQRNEDLEKELEGIVSKPNDRGTDMCNNVSKEKSMEEQSGELVEQYKALTNKLEEKNRILETALKEKDLRMNKVQEQYEEILKHNKEKEENIVDLEFELLTAAQEKCSKTSEKEREEKSERDVDFYVKLLQKKDDEIHHLNAKLHKRNCDLQGLVNNELWEKNREIEKLQKKQVTKLMECKDYEIVKLRNDLKTKENQLKIIKEKISELGIEIDLQSGDVSVDNNLQLELERSEKLRKEANQVCGLLSKRLEELATFLDYLLKQKTILGFLGTKENKRLRQIIDQSLDLSRSFTMSMINPEQSLVQLTNLTSFLNDTNEDDGDVSKFSLIPDNATHCSYLYKNNIEDSSQIIETLRQKIVNLKYELQLRDVELNKVNDVTVNLIEVSSEKEEQILERSVLNTTSTTLKYRSDNQSESEAWSEPDRSVSRARIGLLDDSLRSNSNKKRISNSSTDSTEDEETKSSRTSSKKCVFNESRNTIIELHKQICDLDQRLSEKELAYCEITKANTKLNEELELLQFRLRNTEDKLVKTEDQNTELEGKLSNLQKEKDELFKAFNAKDKEMQNKVNQIEVQKMEALSAHKEAEETAEVVKNEMKIAEMKLQSLQAQMTEMEVNLRNEYQSNLIQKIQIIENESLKKIKHVQNTAEMEIKSLHSTIKKLQVEYSMNYVRKCEVEEVLEEIDRMKNVTESLEEHIEKLSNEEQYSKKKLTEYEERINSLRNDLDNATLQYSEAVLEKTKMANEKAYIEQELGRSILKEADTKKRLDEVESELVGLRQNNQKQVSSLQMHKSKLEVRVSELESSNAELHNRLIKIQAGCGDYAISPTLPITPNFVNQIVSFRRQHSENSYLSEEHMLLDDVKVPSGRAFNRLVPTHNIDIERNENSSPDLGIESDHGRFSSLETHLNVQRPLLQTLELTESMSNLLDVENNHVQEGDCGNSDCCQTTLEMAQENADLKRKLLRTRRALEETVTQLTLANQRKKQVEKTICKQIHKTSQVLRKAKANLDSGSETDVYKT